MNNQQKKRQTTNENLIKFTRFKPIMHQPIVRDETHQHMMHLDQHTDFDALRWNGTVCTTGIHHCHRLQQIPAATLDRTLYQLCKHLVVAQ
jgi:hypothetical protein